VVRVSIWFFDKGTNDLTCTLSYTTDDDRHDEGLVIHVTRAPTYVAALRTARVFVANDVTTHEGCRELADYLSERSIGAMLDAPIFRDGEVIGVVCHEHLGAPRVWQPREIDFAGSVADIVSSLYLEQRLLQVEEEMRSQASVRQDADKLASLTLITQAFAHDVNNALTVASLVGSRLAAQPPSVLTEMGNELVQASSFASRILHDLRAFASRDGTERVAIDVVVESFRPVLAALLRGRSTLVVEIRAPGAIPAMSRTHLEQVLLNLCVNARDASAATITLRVTPNDAANLRIEVADDGEGIPASILDRVFEPYVTTKTAGSGLGLAIVKRLVDGAGGSIRVVSGVLGTTFTITLPLA
jgi:signal transduction histidine kinase